MHVIDVMNVNQALSQGLRLLNDHRAYTEEESRNGPVRVADMPVTTVTRIPMERVLFSPLRKANPFFHLFESLWMLAGRDDLPWLAQFNKRMAEFSDDGGRTQPAAYGYRWRKYFGYDQLDRVVEHLREFPDSRRAVLAMWDGGDFYGGTERLDHNGDLEAAMQGSKDVPCNTHIYFRIRQGELHMTVCCRSNDIWWGAHGANAVHFSVLLEYMAARLNVAVGSMTQVSNNYHVYTDVVQDLGVKADDAIEHDLYSLGGAMPTRIFMFTEDDMAAFHEDLPIFMEYVTSPCSDPAQKYAWREEAPVLNHPFLRDVAVPMLKVWDLHKMGDYEAAAAECVEIGNASDCDWRVACSQWIERASKRKEV